MRLLKNLLESQSVFASQIFESKVEGTKNLTIEIFDDALLYAIKNLGVKIFGSMALFANVSYFCRPSLNERGRYLILKICWILIKFYYSFVTVSTLK
jgi:hypothetical protein